MAWRGCAERDGGRPLRAGAGRAGVGSRAHVQRLVAAAQRRLRSVRERENGAQVQRQQVYAAVSSNYLYPYSPIGQTPETRKWRDCDLIPGTATCSAQVLATNRDDIAQDNEIGPTSNLRFGQAADRRVDPDMQREYDWDYSVGVQHELFPRISVSAGWYTTRSYDAQRPYNTLRSFSDYTPFTTTNPLDGTPITLFNLNPSKLGIVDIVDINSDVNRHLYDGYELSMQARRANGAQLLVGWAMERNRDVICDTDDPNRLRFCDQTGELFQEFGEVPGIPFRHEFKVAGSYPLPWGLQAGVSFVSYPGATCNCPGSVGDRSGASVAWTAQRPLDAGAGCLPGKPANGIRRGAPDRARDRVPGDVEPAGYHAEVGHPRRPLRDAAVVRGLQPAQLERGVERKPEFRPGAGQAVADPPGPVHQARRAHEVLRPIGRGPALAPPNRAAE